MPNRQPILKPTKLVLGIDPGINGAIAAYGQLLNIPVVEDCPTVKVKVNKTMRTRCDAVGMAGVLRKFLDSTFETHVFLEQVNAHPKQGVSSMFSFGQAFGMWLGVLGALNVSYSVVTPQAWKKKMMAGMAKEKDASRVRVVQLWPELHGKLGAKNKGRADAILIAAYGRRELGW